MNWWQRLIGRKAEQSPSLRQQREELEEQIRLKRLQRAAKLNESYADTDYWLTAYADLLARYKDGFALAYPITQPTDRRWGGNFPFWYSEQQLGLIRAQARLLATMSPNAQGLLNGVCSYVIGTGYQYDVVAKPNREIPDKVLTDIQDAIDRFIDDNAWSELEQELFTRSRQDGEFFLRLFPQNNGRMMVRVIEPEQVFMPPGSQLANYGYGIKTDPDDVCNVISYSVSYVAPGGEGGDSAMACEDVPADEIVHCKVNVPRNIKRGLTDFSYDTLDAFMVASKLRNNLGEGAAVQAAIAGVRQHDAASFNQVDTFVNTNTDYANYSPVTQRATSFEQIKSGTFIDIPKGMNYVPPPSAANPDAHLNIFQALLRSAGNRHNAPEWLVSADASNNNYASSMTAESPFLRHCKRLQKFYERPFIRVIKAAIQNAIDAGRLPLKILDHVDITATAPQLEVQDLAGAANANQSYVSMGVKSRQTVAQELGLDWDTELTNQQEYAEQMGAAGSLPDTPGLDTPSDIAPDIDAPANQSQVADTALNGAQITSLVDLAAKAQAGELPVASAKAIAMASFPSVSSQLIASIFDEIKPKSFQQSEDIKSTLEPVQVSGESSGLLDTDDSTPRKDSKESTIQQRTRGTVTESEKYNGIDFTPPKGARAAAKRALAVRDKKPDSEKGMTPVGIARARDLSNGATLSPETVRRMKAYFDRHQSDKSGETWDEQGKGWQAWNGWGGDAGYSWAKKIVKQMDDMDAQE